ncbi:cysteine hydrolase [Mycobacterium colombiense]|uniref:isochorismatase family protein n=1 Tax=Mycobacterium colombiense TaxID=339268 RepID=UPI0007EF3093|nr:isochorismatase family protein [Mycobacterium colombiense]OBK68571.1 cysteine hydrolase [Mycobacterium colombiense]
MPRPRLTPEDPSEAAVVCVECQNGVIGPDSILPDLSAHIGDLIPNLRRLLHAARGAGVRVVHATYAGSLGGKQVSTARLFRTTEPATADWRPGDPPTQVLPELFATTDLVLPRHHGLMPASNTELLPVLANLGVRTVILTGVSLNVAIPLTAGPITEAGFNLVVPKDAVAGSPPAYGEQVLLHTLAVLGRITSVNDLVAEWSAPGTTP